MTLAIHVRGPDATAHALALDDRPARRVARVTAEADGAFRYDLPPDTPGLIILLGNRPQLPALPAVVAFATEPGRLLTVRVDRGGGRYAAASTLVLFFYDEAELIERVRVPLGSGDASASVRVPERPARVALALRLIGTNVVRDLSLSWTTIEPPVASAPPTPASPAVTQTAPTAPAAPTARTAGPPAVSAPPASAPWDAIREQARAGSARVVAGVADPAGAAAASFRAIRVDEDAAPPRLGVGYVFDTRVADRTFGWEGVFGAENIPANLALARHLSAVRAARLPAVLLCDGEAARRPFFADFSALFTRVLGPDPAPGGPDLAGLFPALSEPLKRALDD